MRCGKTPQLVLRRLLTLKSGAGAWKALGARDFGRWVELGAGLLAAETGQREAALAYFSVTTRRQLNTLLRRVGLLGTSDVPHWTYNVEDVRALLPGGFRWSIAGGILVGRKAFRLSHAAHLGLHRSLGRLLPQPLLRAFGQSLFVYGRREAR